MPIFTDTHTLTPSHLTPAHPHTSHPHTLTPASGESERAMYYNLDADATFGDLTREEALRWDVLPLGK